MKGSMRVLVSIYEPNQKTPTRKQVSKIADEEQFEQVIEDIEEFIGTAYDELLLEED